MTPDALDLTVIDSVFGFYPTEEGVFVQLDSRFIQIYQR